ncbi:MAG: class I adenylate-forming enzyme family protein [bacterium]
MSVHSFADLVAVRASSNPDKPVLTFVTVGQNGELEEETRTYQQLLGSGQRLAHYLSERGVRHGDAIGLMMNNHPQFVETMVATSHLGAVFVPVDPRTQGSKLSYMLSFVECRGVVCADYCLENIVEVLPDCPDLQWLLVINTEGAVASPPIETTGAILLEDYQTAINVAVETPPQVAQSPCDPFLMMFTSGTTGNPKAVVFSNERYLGLTQTWRIIGLTPEDKYYSGLSLTHVNAQGTLAGAIGGGIPAVFSRKFTKSRLFDIIRRYNCTTMHLLGGMIPEIYAIPEQPDDASIPLRLVQSSGMPVHLWHKFEERFGIQLIECYGATEGGGLFKPPGEGPVGSMGKPVPGSGWVADILDEDGNPCAPHVEGEICFRREDNGAINLTYFKNPEASAEKVRGGWLHMGDLAHKDEEGWIFFHHRVGGGVRKNGDFVNTALVESVLIESPLVQDAYVYGVPTEKNVAGEKTLVAAIVPAKDSGFDQSALLKYCAAHLQKNEVPEILQVLEDIPKTISEKPIERACIDLLRKADLV